MLAANFWEFPGLLVPCVGIFIMALLYSSVGHGGASGYLAVLGLLSLAPAALRPTALVLNILVSGLASWRFYQAGYFSWARLWPFALASVPLAFLGGKLSLPPLYYRPLVGAVLLFSAAHLFWRPSLNPQKTTQPPPLLSALSWGGLFGFLSGLTGVGGGIFLSPLLLLKRWAGLREASATAAVFILVNSTAGLLGRLQSVASLPTFTPIFAACALGGGWIGATAGSRRFSLLIVNRILATVLTVAGAKLIFFPV